jgi:hypothetical protein
MPDAEKSCSEVDEVLGRRLGLSRELSAALLGAHTLGRARLNNTGYDGSWKVAQSTNKLDNGYYQAIVVKGWGPETSVGGNRQRNQWQRVDIGVDEPTYGKEMMLNTDLCLLYTPIDHSEMNNMYAANSSCSCAWSAAKLVLEAIEGNGGEFCGLPNLFPTLEGGADLSDGGIHLVHPDDIYYDVNTLNFTKERVLCCGVDRSVILNSPIDLTPGADCGVPGNPASRWRDFVLNFAADEQMWLEKFHEAWQIATSSGQSSLSLLRSSTE